MMTDLATRPNGVVDHAPMTLAARMGLTQEQVDLIRKTVAKNATDTELEFFLSTAKRAGLDPIAKQIYFIKRGNDASIQTGIDGYRSIAERTGQYDGQDPPQFTFRPDGKLDSATVTVWRKGMGRGISSTAFWSEYAQRSPLWERMPRTMLAKCAESLALRKAFPQVMGGVYTADEMAQARNEKALLEDAHDGDAPQAALEAPKPMEPKPDEGPAPAMSAIVEAFKAAGIAGSLKEWLAEHIAPNLAERKRAILTPDEAREAHRRLTSTHPDVEDAQIKPQDAPESSAEPEEAPEQTTLLEGSAPPAFDGFEAQRLLLGWTPDELGNFIEELTETTGYDEATQGVTIVKKGVRDARKLNATQRDFVDRALRAEMSA